MKKTIIFIFIILLTIIIGVIVGINLNNDEAIPTYAEKIESKIENNNITNNTTINNVENNVMENTIEEPEEDNEKGKEESEQPKTDLDKAIDIVKKDWGEDRGVYFAQDGKTQSGDYIICVRDAETTSALTWYTVNIETGKFEKE